MSVIKRIDPLAIPMDLLLLADPSEEKIRGYLAHSVCFCAMDGQQIVGACVLIAHSAEKYELMNIAVLPDFQKKRIGSQLLQYSIHALRQIQVYELEVGTGTFGYQLAFYQRQGFRVNAIDRDFFITHYKEPIFEEGIQHKDMLRLTLQIN